MILQEPKNPSSENVDAQQIQDVISRTAKHTKFNYRCVVDKSRKDRWAARQDKVWARLREEWSVEAFKEARTRYWHMNQFQQRHFIEQQELAHDRR